jgi:nitrogen regulatory protein PII
MVVMMALIIGYIYTQFTGDTLSLLAVIVVSSLCTIAIRISAGIVVDRALPNIMGFIHTQFNVPHMAMGDIIAFKQRKDFSLLKHGIIPGLGVITNVIMLAAIIYLYSVGNADAKAEADICFLIAGGWALVSIAYAVVTSVKRSYSLKMVSAMIRPDMLNVLVDVLKDNDLILGMTVAKVHGFGRQKGNLDKDAEPINDKISFIPKVKVDLVVNDWDVPGVMEIMRDVLFTGTVGDGKIFVYDAIDAMRIRTGEKGVYAV